MCPLLLQVYLSVPDHMSLSEGHCLLAPVTHSASVVTLDEDILAEINVSRSLCSHCAFFALHSLCRWDNDVHMAKGAGFFILERMLLL